MEADKSLSLRSLAVPSMGRHCFVECTNEILDELKLLMKQVASDDKVGWDLVLSGPHLGLE